MRANWEPRDRPHPCSRFPPSIPDLQSRGRGRVENGVALISIWRVGFRAFVKNGSYQNTRPPRIAGSTSPSPRFAESAEQNGERAGVRCSVPQFYRPCFIKPNAPDCFSPRLFSPLEPPSAIHAHTASMPPSTNQETAREMAIAFGAPMWFILPANYAYKSRNEDKRALRGHSRALARRRSAPAH
jgi:hypothetical protein